MTKQTVQDLPRAFISGGKKAYTPPLAHSPPYAQAPTGGVRVALFCMSPLHERGKRRAGGCYRIHAAFRGAEGPPAAGAGGAPRGGGGGRRFPAGAVASEAKTEQFKM